MTPSRQRNSAISAFILAGGENSRMGSDKGLLKFGGVPLVAHTARMLERFAQEVVVISAPERYSHLGLRVIPDMVVRANDDGAPLHTPLVGIATALSVSASPWSLILACDLPYLASGWLEWLLTRTMSSHAQVVMPRTSNGLEPLAAAYHSECLTPILEALKRGVRKVTDATSRLRTEIVAESDWSEFDPEHSVLANMNSPTDYQRAKEWWQRRRGAG